MRAFRVLRLSDDLSGTAVEDIPQPVPGPGEVLLRVAAASVNFPDVLMCAGGYQLKPALPFTLGGDVAGEAAAVGAGVEGVLPGDALMGSARLGAFADYAVAPAHALVPKPAHLSFSEAAALPAAYLTAYVALVRCARLEAGETLLVHGAAGGMGLAAVDLGKVLGARVIATASTAEKRSAVAAHGADHVLDSTGFREPVKALTGGRGGNVIFDPVGGDVFDESVRCIAFDGRLLVVGFAGGRIATIRTNLPLIKGFSVVGVRAGEYGRQFPEKGRENWAAIHALAEAGKLRPYVSREFPLSRTREALAVLKDRQAIGKVIVRPDLD